jgi:hypothetical protein
LDFAKIVGALQAFYRCYVKAKKNFELE